MNAMVSTRTLRLSAVAAALFTTAAARAVIPIQGMPVPALSQFDTLMADFMEDNDIHGALLGIMKDGVIVYQRGFGWKDEAQTILLRHDDIMRVASITKPFTAAAIQHLYAGNWLEPDDVVFDLGQPGGGILPYSAFNATTGTLVQYPNIPDDEMQDITVQQILAHRSGLPCNTGCPDPMFLAIQIADAFNNAGIPTTYPPGVTRSTQWMLGQQLQFTPGTSYSYSNPGFMVLGQVVEAVSGETHLDYVKQHVLAPLDWLPLNEVVFGRTFAADQDPREPWYEAVEIWPNVFDPNGPNVSAPYGGWHHELHFASGGFAASTTTLLHFAENYYVNRDSNADAGLYGMPTNGARDDRNHGGTLRGTSARLQQRSDGVNFAVIFNQRDNGGTDFGTTMAGLINAALDAGGITWPSQGVDGQWVDFGAPLFGTGSYEEPWRFLGIALSNSVDEATLNFKPGSSSWTGSIAQRVRLRAPEGGVVSIGVVP